LGVGQYKLVKKTSNVVDDGGADNGVSDVGVLDASDGILEGRLEVLVVLFESCLVVLQHVADEAVVDSVGVRESVASFRLQVQTVLIRCDNTKKSV